VIVIWMSNGGVRGSVLTPFRSIEQLLLNAWIVMRPRDELNATKISVTVNLPTLSPTPKSRPCRSCGVWCSGAPSPSVYVRASDCGGLPFISRHWSYCALRQHYK